MKMETCKDICHTFGMKELYSLRKETIERGSASAKENHEFWYMQMFGKAWMEMKVGLTFACMNLKKLAKIKAKWGLLEEGEPHKISILYTIRIIREKWLWDTNPRAALSTVWGGQAMLALLNGCVILVTILRAYTIFIQLQCRTVDNVLLPDAECIPPMPDSHRW